MGVSVRENEKGDVVKYRGKKEGDIQRDMTVLREQGCAVEEESKCWEGTVDGIIIENKDESKHLDTDDPWRVIS